MNYSLWGLALALSLGPVVDLTAATQMDKPKELAGSNFAFKAKDYSHLKGLTGLPDDLIAMHLKLYEGYVKNANAIREKVSALASDGKDKSPEYGALKRLYGWEYDGMRLHEYYFDNLGGHDTLAQDSALYQAIETDFGSYDKWKQDFVATGLMRGIGWAILYYDPQTGRLTNTWINEHDLGHLAGNTPLLIMDVFEHAYITKYALDRAAYIDAFFKNIDWSVVSQRYDLVKK